MDDPFGILPNHRICQRFLLSVSLSLSTLFASSLYLSPKCRKRETSDKTLAVVPSKVRATIISFVPASYDVYAHLVIIPRTVGLYRTEPSTNCPIFDVSYSILLREILGVNGTTLFFQVILYRGDQPIAIFLLLLIPSYSLLLLPYFAVSLFVFRHETTYSFLSTIRTSTIFLSRPFPNIPF